MVLWKKEPAAKSAFYVDLLPEREQNHFHHTLMRMMRAANNKNADKSTELRTRGNQQFKAKNWDEAINFYDKSLRFAPNGSENLSLAYANRSMCFFQMQKYEQCLVDIELARKTNYPKRLMHKLEEREAACLKLMTDEQTKAVQKVRNNIGHFHVTTRYRWQVNDLNIECNFRQRQC